MTLPQAATLSRDLPQDPGTCPADGPAGAAALTVEGPGLPRGRGQSSGARVPLSLRSRNGNLNLKGHETLKRHRRTLQVCSPHRLRGSLGAARQWHHTLTNVVRLRKVESLPRRPDGHLRVKWVVCRYGLLDR